MSEDFDRLLVPYRERVDEALEARLPGTDTAPARLHEAMRYAVLGAGKRVRPALCYASGEALGVPLERLDGPACAVELIHAYSLIHDDLPAMDDDDLRRGRPTCHRAFDEATAILAGDALHALAFRTLAHDPHMVDDAAARLSMVDHLALACGSRGMVGGQVIDLASEGKSLSEAELEFMHIHKTGALIRASVNLAALSAPDATEENREALDHMGKVIGLAFQIKDDILDVEGDTEVMGKSSGADQGRQKSTYPSVVGLEAAYRRLDELREEAETALGRLTAATSTLQSLCRFIVSRTL